jgi:hypothetical protein
MAEVYAELAERPLARESPEDVPSELSLENVLEGLRDQSASHA